MINTVQYQGAGREAILKDPTLNHFMNVISIEGMSSLASKI